MDYKVITTDSLRELVSRVNHDIGFNWKPLGGVCIYPSEKTITATPSGQHSVKLNYAQALIKD